MAPLIGVLVFVLVVFLLVWLGCLIIDKALPGEVQMPAKVVLGVVGLIAVLYKLLPMAGI